MEYKRKIIFVTNYPIDKRDAKRFGFEILNDAGFKILIWDVSEFFYKNIEKINIDYYESNYVVTTKFYSLKEIKSETKKMEKHDVLIIAGTTINIRSIKTFLLNKMFRKTHGYYTAITWGDHPIHVSEDKKNVFLANSIRLVRFIRRIFYKNYLASVIWREFNDSTIIKYVINVTNLISPLETVWLATLGERIPKISIGKKTVLRFIHNLDYDLFLEMNNNNTSNQFRPVVILDSMGPLHPDYLAESRESTISLSTYSKMINIFINKFEIETDKKIIIAAHPRSDLETIRKLYGDTDVFFHKTSEIVSQSSAVISIDGSTAIGFAVMWRKPLIILNSNVFDSQSRKFNKLFSSLLGATEIDLDSDYSIPRIMGIDNDLYDDYQNKYIKRPGTPNNLFWKVVVEDIKNGFKKT